MKLKQRYTMDIQKRINDLCQNKNWTLYQLSVRAGLSANTVYSWKKKNIIPTIPVIEKICDAFEISLEQFFCGFVGTMTKEERELLEVWQSLSDIEKKAINNLIETYLMLKRAK